MPREMREEVDARPVRPVKVVEKKRDRRGSGGLPYEPLHRSKKPSKLLGALRGRAGSGREMIGEEPREIRPPLRNPISNPPRSGLEKHRQRFEERIKRRAARRLVASPGGHEEAEIPSAHTRFLSEPRLPDPRLPREKEGSPRPFGDGFENGRDPGRLLFTRHEPPRRNRPEKTAGKMGSGGWEVGDGKWGARGRAEAEREARSSSGSSRASARRRTVFWYGVLFTPRSRLLMVRTPRPEREASSSCVIPAASRWRLSKTPNVCERCVVMKAFPQEVCIPPRMGATLPEVGGGFSCPSIPRARKMEFVKRRDRRRGMNTAQKTGSRGKDRESGVGKYMPAEASPPSPPLVSIESPSRAGADADGRRKSRVSRLPKRAEPKAKRAPPASRFPVAKRPGLPVFGFWEASSPSKSARPSTRFWRSRPLPKSRRRPSYTIHKTRSHSSSKGSMRSAARGFRRVLAYPSREGESTA